MNYNSGNIGLVYLVEDSEAKGNEPNVMESGDDLEPRRLRPYEIARHANRERAHQGIHRYIHHPKSIKLSEDVQAALFNR